MGNLNIDALIGFSIQISQFLSYSPSGSIYYRRRSYVLTCRALSYLVLPSRILPCLPLSCLLILPVVIRSSTRLRAWLRVRARFSFHSHLGQLSSPRCTAIGLCNRRNIFPCVLFPRVESHLPAQAYYCKHIMAYYISYSLFDSTILLRRRRRHRLSALA